MIPILFITYNRLDYTKKALQALLNTNYAFKLFIWDNGSTDGTDQWLKRYVSMNHNVAHIEYRTKNLGINYAFNEFIKQYSKYDFIAKVDNDTIVDSLWLKKLSLTMIENQQLDALGAFMQRPPGEWDFQTWVDSVMKKEYLKQEFFDCNGELIVEENYLAYNSYTGGTGVLIRTQIFRDYGLLFNKYPCLLGDWTTYQRLIFNNKNIAWYSGSVVKLLNIKIDGKELTNDFPIYDEQLKIMRDEGNNWYSKIGGAPGVANFIQQSGGRERIANE